MSKIIDLYSHFATPLFYGIANRATRTIMDTKELNNMKQSIIEGQKVYRSVWDNIRDLLIDDYIDEK